MRYKFIIMLEIIMTRERFKTALKDWCLQLLYGFAVMHIFIGVSYLLTVAGVDVVGYLDKIFG